MIIPPQITFHNMPPSPQLEREIRERIDSLESFYPDMVGCRVLVDLPHKHRERGRAFHVTVELSLPGEDVVVSHQPTLHATLKDMGEETRHKASDIGAVDKYASVAVHEAFELTRRRLQDFARRQRGDVKAHVPPAHGRVAALPVGADYGFIETDDGRSVYFHQASVLEDGFDRLEVGTEVAFVEEPGEKGPQASTVRILGRHHYVSP